MTMLKEVPIAEGDADARTIAQIEEWIANPPTTSRIVTISPAVALHLLQTYNDENRTKKPGKIEEYRGYMSQNLWMVTGDTIKFSDRKLIRDGQNRLTACVRSGRAFTTHAVFGIPDIAFKFIDRGRIRDGADILKIAGYNNTTQLAAVVRWAYLIEEGRTKSRDTLDPNLILSLLQDRYANNGIIARTQVARKIWNATREPVGIIGGCFYHFHMANPVAATELEEAWILSDLRTRRAAPFKKMQTRVKEIKKFSAGRVHDVLQAAFLVMAWNAFVANETMSVADFSFDPSEDAFPQIRAV
jgi:hypothetical protein